jgi:hypothetical protein
MNFRTSYGYTCKSLISALATTKRSGIPPSGICSMGLHCAVDNTFNGFSKEPNSLVSRVVNGNCGFVIVLKTSTYGDSRYKAPTNPGFCIETLVTKSPPADLPYSAVLKDWIPYSSFKLNIESRNA